jgi:hypothetical protein
LKKKEDRRAKLYKSSGLLGIFAILPLIMTTLASAATVLNPPGHGFPAFSKNQPITPLNTEMTAALVDDKYFVEQQSVLMIQNNPQKRIYESSYVLPDKAFGILCNLSVEQGAIHITVGNIELVVLPSETAIYQDGKVIKKQEVKGVRGVGFERGYDFENKLRSVARIHTDGYALGADVVILFPTKISLTVMANTVGSIEGWQWVRGMK